jgi:hypothetical protein
MDYNDKNFIFVEQDMDQIKLYNIRRTDLHLTDDKAADFVSAMGTMALRELDARIQGLATKDDLRQLSLVTKDEIQKLSLETKSDIHSLDMKIEQLKSHLFKTISRNSVVQFIAIVASMLAIVKFIK